MKNIVRFYWAIRLGITWEFGGPVVRKKIQYGMAYGMGTKKLAQIRVGNTND